MDRVVAGVCGHLPFKRVSVQVLIGREDRDASISSERSFLWFCWAMVALSPALLVVTHPNWGLSKVVVMSAIAGGVLNGLGAWTSFRALESGGKASIVISLISLYPLLTVVLAVLFLGERLSWRQAAGAVTALLAAILLSLEATSKPEVELGPAETGNDRL